MILSSWPKSTPAREQDGGGDLDVIEWEGDNDTAS